MAIIDLFRPRWKHSNPDIRIAAARSADYTGLGTIAHEAPDNDVFRVAVARLAGGWGSTYTLSSLIRQLTRSQRNAWPPPELVRQRLEILVEEVKDPSLIEQIALGSQPAVAVTALARLPDASVRRVLKGTGSEVVRQAAIEHVFRNTSALVDEINHPSFPYLKDHVRTLLQDALNKAVGREDWEAIKRVVSGCADVDLQTAAVLLLPGGEIDLPLLAEIVKDKRGNFRRYPHSLLAPILRRMQEAGWTLQEKAVEVACPSCGSKNIPGHHENDGVWYDCGTCNATGELSATEISAQFRDRHSSLVFPD